MRERMRKELSTRRSAGEFDIKQDAGGMADIEFLAQYWALRWARTHPPVAMFSDTIRQLESVASADLVPQATVDVLTAPTAPTARARTTCRWPSEAADRAGRPNSSTERAAVTPIWNEAMGATMPATIIASPRTRKPHSWPRRPSR